MKLGIWHKQRRGTSGPVSHLRPRSNQVRLERFGLAVTLAALLGTASAQPSGATDALFDLAARTLSQLDGEIALAGLHRPVEVLRDRWGVPHIYAENTDDLFFAQGFVAAQDRLWQMEWWRRFGEGRLAEVLGAGAVAHDRFARLLRYRGDLEQELTSYHPEGKRILSAFVRGVNAYIDRKRADPPVEFQLTGVRPEHWTLAVPLLRMAGLAMTGNNLREVDLALQVRRLGLERANRLDHPDPFRKLRVAPGLRLDVIPEDFRRRVLGAPLRRPPLLLRFAELLSRSPVTSLEGAAAPDLRSLVAGTPDPEPRWSERDLYGGSNNWVVSGDRTESGLPLLANDPHRALTLPSLRYLVHLSAPGWNVIGAGEPALPGVAIGHNERIAWGLTIVGMDQGDIYVEQLHPADPNRVRWGEGWDELRTVRETVRVRDGGPRDLELQFSRHGPILYKDLEHRVAYAFRTVLTEPGTAGYLGALRVDQARDWSQYLRALQAWKVPSENLVYADVDGHIGWVAAGLAPVRAGWDGRLPVPGDGRFEWTRFRTVRELPQEHDPERGYIATANHNIMPPGYDPPLGFRWADPVRFERIRQVLEATERSGIEQFERLQQDVYSSVADRRRQVFAHLRSEDPVLGRYVRMLQRWDARLAAGSAAAALYKAWERAVLQDAAAREVPADFTDPAVASKALAEAVSQLRREQGSDPGHWRWGRSNFLRLEHPVVSVFDAGTVERPGDGTTLNVGYPGHGASFREILDPSDWDRSVATSTPGQSGQPSSPYYTDLLDDWAAGRYFPLVYSRKAVERETRHHLLLRPVRDPGSPGPPRAEAAAR